METVSGPRSLCELLECVADQSPNHSQTIITMPIGQKLGLILHLIRHHYPPSVQYHPLTQSNPCPLEQVPYIVRAGHPDPNSGYLVMFFEDRILRQPTPHINEADL